MKILVLGAGGIGVTTAYYLARDGCEVTVVEEQDGVGRESSGSNASILAAGHVFAWASPRAPLMLLRSLLGQQTAIRVRLTPDPGLYAWGLLFLRECTANSVPQEAASNPARRRRPTTGARERPLARPQVSTARSSS